MIRIKIEKLKSWVEKWADTPHAMFALCVLAFAESSFFPIPPDVLLIAILLSNNNRAKWWRYATVCTVASVLGGLFGYFIGYAFFEGVGKQIIHFYKLDDLIAIVGQKYEEHAFFAVFAAGFTPIPYKVFTIAAGFFQISVLPFVVASILGRGGRFFLVAILLKYFGSSIKKFIYDYLNILSLIFVILVVLGFVALGTIFK
jgi:membrane protein YqaA with SNARE-associated domain